MAVFGFCAWNVCMAGRRGRTRWKYASLGVATMEGEYDGYRLVGSAKSSRNTVLHARPQNAAIEIEKASYYSPSDALTSQTTLPTRPHLQPAFFSFRASRLRDSQTAARTHLRQSLLPLPVQSSNATSRPHGSAIEPQTWGLKYQK